MVITTIKVNAHRFILRSDIYPTARQMDDWAEDIGLVLEEVYVNN